MWLVAAGAALWIVSSGAAQAEGKGWSQTATVSVKVHDHAFNEARVEADGCTLRFRVYFDAPEKAYKDRNVVRNWYRFVAQAKLKKGQTVTSKLFFNRSPGRRVYAFSEDTTGAGCWAKEKNGLINVDVNACRGERCVVEPFE